MTSTNGINWTGRGTIFTTAGNGVAWNGSMWIAVGQGTNTIAYSYDGITWSGISSPPITTAGYAIAWSGSTWVAVGQGGNSIAYSYDGIVWTGTTGTTLFSSFGLSVSWNGSIWIAGGQGTNTIATSTDGITWTARGTSIFSVGMRSAYGYKYTTDIAAATTLSKYLIAGAGTNSLGFTINGTTYNPLNSLTTFTTQGNAVFYDSGSGKWVAVGQGGNTIATSNDGMMWTGRGATTFTTAGNDVISDGSKWIAVGQGGNTVATSTDSGATWTGQSLSYFAAGNSIN
jgi:hypothetical protein